jgi:hypothetical protein
VQNMSLLVVSTKNVHREINTIGHSVKHDPLSFAFQGVLAEANASH